VSLIDSAVIFAASAHSGQRRKYDGLPYITHPIEVMATVHRYGGTAEMAAAAVLHDVVEDTPVTLDDIQAQFGVTVENYVRGLTDQFTSEAYPHMSRAARKQAEADRLGSECAEVQTIKYADLISNIASIISHDPGFARIYLVEKQRVMELMLDGHQGLRHLAMAMLAIAQTELMQRKLQ